MKKTTLHIVAGIMAALIVISDSDKDMEQLSNDLEKVVGDKSSLDELTTSELLSTINVLKKHIMA